MSKKVLVVLLVGFWGIYLATTKSDSIIDLFIPNDFTSTISTVVALEKEAPASNHTLYGDAGDEKTKYDTVSPDVKVPTMPVQMKEVAQQLAQQAAVEQKKEEPKQEPKPEEPKKEEKAVEPEKEDVKPEPTEEKPAEPVVEAVSTEPANEAVAPQSQSTRPRELKQPKAESLTIEQVAQPVPTVESVNVSNCPECNTGTYYTRPW